MATDIGSLSIKDELTSFTWTIDFSACSGKKVEESIWSPSFLTPHHHNGTSEWKLQLYLNGINRKSRGYLSLYLRHVAEQKSSFFQKSVYFSILNNKNEETNRVDVELFSIFNKDPPGVDKFIGKSVVVDEAKGLLLDGKLTIVCCIANMRTIAEISSKSSTLNKVQEVRPMPLPRGQSKNNLLDSESESESDAESETNKKLPDILDDFELLLKRGRSDVILIASGRKFYAHKVILSARSSVFATMLEQDKIVKKKIVVDMGDLSCEILKRVMRFIYIGTVTNLQDTAHELLAPANKYALNGLKAMCEDMMIKNLNLNNASEYLVLSFLHEADKLRSQTMDFVVENSKDIMDTQGFKSMAGSHAQVIAAIFEALTRKDNSKG